jgi:hypothetical protein
MRLSSHSKPVSIVGTSAVYPPILSIYAKQNTRIGRMSGASIYELLPKQSRH